MSRRPAVLTQAEVRRVIRGAKQAGAAAVEVRPDGKIIVLFERPDASTDTVDQSKDIVL